MKLKFFIILLLGVFSVPAFADTDDHADDSAESRVNDFWNTQNCTGSKWKDSAGNTISIDDKFGPGSMAVTRCLAKTERVKILYQINTGCKDSTCTAPYAVGNIKNHIVDMKTTHGMTDDDFEIVVVVHSAGWKLVLDDAARNDFRNDMVGLVNTPSVKVLFCQNTAAKKGVMLSDMIDGIGFTTSGVSAISDLQAVGYRYVQP